MRGLWMDMASGWMSYRAQYNAVKGTDTYNVRKFFGSLDPPTFVGISRNLFLSSFDPTMDVICVCSFLAIMKRTRINCTGLL